LLADRAHPVLKLVLGGLAGDAIACLQYSEQCIPSAFDLVEVIVRQLAPLLKHLVLKILPISFHAFPIHPSPLLSLGVGRDTSTPSEYPRSDFFIRMSTQMN
jgi:hypothetical protein